MSRTKLGGIEVVGFLLLLLVGCDGSSAPKTESAELYARGRAVYVMNCTACHNTDPAKPGPVGPAILGSSLELVRARLSEATYPEGYTPKRATKQMSPLPHLAKHSEALYAFLNP